MSSSSCLVFFGVRIGVAASEIEAVENRTDERVRRARAAKLSHYFGRFVVGGLDGYFLFVGNKIATIGPEAQDNLEITPSDLVARTAETARQLVDAGWSTSPRLFIQYEPDC